MELASDPFRTLALPYDAAPGDVRRAFRALARQTHPDRGGSADAFQAVHAAYRALTADLDAERRRWQAAAEGARYAAGLDPRLYPTCPVIVGRTREGRRTEAYAAAARPDGWRPGPAPPPGGTCRAQVAATEATPAFGIWTVPAGGRRYRCVFGPPPDDG